MELWFDWEAPSEKLRWIKVNEVLRQRKTSWFKGQDDIMASEAILWRRRKFCEVNCASNTCFLAARVPLVTSSSTSVLIDKDEDWKSLKVSGFFQEHLNMQRPPSLTFDANPVILLVLKCDLVFIGYSWGAFKGSSAHMPLYCRLYWLLPLRRLTAVGQSEESRLFRRVSLETLELKQLVLDIR